MTKNVHTPQNLAQNQEISTKKEKFSKQEEISRKNVHTFSLNRLKLWIVRKQSDGGEGGIFQYTYTVYPLIRVKNFKQATPFLIGIQQTCRNIYSPWILLHAIAFSNDVNNDLQKLYLYVGLF